MTDSIPAAGGPLEPRERLSYGQFRLKLAAAILSSGLSPLRVAQILEKKADAYPEITLAECRRLREMGEVWEPYEGSENPKGTWLGRRFIPPWPWVALGLTRDQWRAQRTPGGTDAAQPA